MSKVRVAVVGVGNCAASLVQGVHYYADADPDARVPGLMHVQFGPYHVRDIEFVAAFDVDAKKVGRDLSEAIVASENNTIKIRDVPPLGVTVARGPTMDGLGRFYRETIQESDEEPVDVAKVLRDTQADVLVAYLPVGSEEADRYYARCALDARVAFVNALPVFIASDPGWAERFRAAGVPIIGDDIKSPGRRDDHASGARPAFRGARRRIGAHDAAQCRWQHGLPEHEGAGPARVQTHLQDAVGDLPDRATTSAGTTCTSGRRTTCPGWTTGSGPMSGSRAAPSGTSRSAWSTSWRSGTHRTPRGIIIDAIRAAKVALDRGIGGPVLSASATS